MSRRLVPTVLWLVLVLVLGTPWSGSAAPVIRVGNGTAASCTETALRNALAVADAQGGGLVTFRCGGKPVTILLTEPLAVPGQTTIDGGNRVTLQAVPINNAFSFTTISVDAASAVVLRNLTLRLGFNVVDNAGELTVQDSSISGSIAHNFINTGTLTILDSAICCEVFDLVGGGIFNLGTLFVNNSTFSDSFGGGVYNGGTAVITNSRFVNNQFPEGNGGAIFNEGTLAIYNTTFSRNVAAARGGAIENLGTLTVVNSAFHVNEASRGGGIANTGTLFLYRSTITGNRGRVTGGGVYNCCGGTTTIVLTTIAGNTPNNVVDAP
jgi:predicted outer membrane repeat protein